MEKGVINSIKIEGVKGEGDYDLSTKEWSVSSSSAAASYNVPISARGLNVGTGTVNLAANATLMMIPQTLGDGAKVTINITPTDKSAVDLTFDLKDTKWVAGNHVTYLLSTTKIIKLNMGSVTYPHWQTAEGSPFTPEKLKSSYASGDAIGMYVVDKYNKVIEENLKFTYNDNDSKWTVESGKEFKGSPQYNYFVYYPYQEGELPGAPAKGTEATEENVASADNFFANAITEWGKRFDTSSGNTIDQSDIAKMNSFDLQIGKADGLGESGTTINFSSMTHAMGLAEIVLGKTRFTNRICYLVGYEEYPTWNGTTTSYASSSIKNHTMYGIADHRYVSIVKPGENSFMSNTDKDAWIKEVKLSPAANEVESGTASIDPTAPHAYTLAVGDIYYSDGAISHQEDALLKSTSKRFPIGIVGYTTMNGDGNYWTEKDTKEKGIGGHALVMCLKNIGSNGTTHLGSSYQWKSSNTDNGRTKVTTAQMIRESYKEQYGSGYRETIALSTSCYPANAAMNYNTLSAPEHICTGWFLPTVGQYYAILMQLGGGIIPDTWQVRDFLGNQYKLTTNVNNALKKIGYNNYSEFFQANCTNIHTSTEFDSQRTIRMDSGVDDGLGSGSIRFVEVLKYYSTTITGVRPFLAF